MDCTFINSNAQSGTNLAKKCLIMLGGFLIPISTAAPVGKVPDDQEAWNQPDFDPRKHVLAQVTCSILKQQKVYYLI